MCAINISKVIDDETQQQSFDQNRHEAALQPMCSDQFADMLVPLERISTEWEKKISRNTKGFGKLVRGDR